MCVEPPRFTTTAATLLLPLYCCLFTAASLLLPLYCCHFTTAATLLLSLYYCLFTTATLLLPQVLEFDIVAPLKSVYNHLDSRGAAGVLRLVLSLLDLLVQQYQY